jgi:hypothetical protein
MHGITSIYPTLITATDMTATNSFSLCDLTTNNALMQQSQPLF